VIAFGELYRRIDTLLDVVYHTSEVTVRHVGGNTNDGRKVPLNYVAEVVSAMGPNTINRENVKRKIVHKPARSLFLQGQR